MCRSLVLVTLPTSICNNAMGQVIGGHPDRYDIPRQDPDMVFFEAAGEHRPHCGGGLAPIRAWDLDLILSPSHGIFNCSFEF